MFGGTPSNLALPYLGSQSEVLSGINLPMIIKIHQNREEPSLRKLAKLAQAEAQKNIFIASELLGKRLLPWPFENMTREERPPLFVDKKLRWWHEGGEILHPRLLTFLQKRLRFDKERGEFYLEDRSERLKVQIEDVPFLVKDFTFQGQEILAVLSNGQIQELDPGSFRIGENGAIYVRLNPEGYEVKFSRQAQARLLQEHLLEADGRFFLCLNHQRYPILKRRG